MVFANRAGPLGGAAFLAHRADTSTSVATDDGAEHFGGSGILVLVATVVFVGSTLISRRA